MQLQARPTPGRQERLAVIPRPSGVKSWTGLIACLLLSACGGGGGVATASTPRGVSTEPAPCGAAPLSVVFVDGTVRVRNAGTRPCVLSGKHPVHLPWWRLVGPEPLAPRGTLAPGATLVQSYRMVGGNGCPGSSRSGGTDAIEVDVEGIGYQVSLAPKAIYEITTCDMALALPPSIEAPAPS